MGVTQGGARQWWGKRGLGPLIWPLDGGIVLLPSGNTMDVRPPGNLRPHSSYGDSKERTHVWPQLHQAFEGT